ncbi:RHS repeat-associated core domain-containing protein [Nitrosomonas sp.]|uniref:RHS repeat-associated core domain-containing protein n=1 Tax=Nitrosomonas sp. TaxID=42353 RepID=UPI0025DCF1FE|nr:RHS repeat-associated core domain-containing protein [Nitrosomonas sp.]
MRHQNGPLSPKFLFFYDPNGQLIGEYRDNSNTATPTDDWLLRQETVWLGDIPVAVIKKPTATGPIQVHYIHADHLNTPRVIVDQTNTIVWRWENMHAFGANLPDEDPDGNGQQFEYNPRFSGQYFDKETGLHYNYFRYYEPETGRYLSPDPIGLMGGINIYGYVGQSPLGFVDRLGLDKTIWFPLGDGRSIADGPRNGNWGGGRSGNVTGRALPLDSADACYMRHDLCYDSGTAKKQCDARLISELKPLPINPRKWPVPSKLGTEADTILFLIGAILIFGP